MRICVRATDARTARSILERLEAAGTAATAILNGADVSGALAQFDVVIAPAHQSQELASFRQARSFVALAAVSHRAGPCEHPGFDGALPIDARPQIIKRLIEQVWRDDAAQRELQARHATLAELNVALQAPRESPADHRLRALFAGRPTAAFLDLTAAFERSGFSMQAALTISSAFDHLHECDIDALVINLDAAEESGLALCGALRRNRRLEGLPCAVLAQTPSLIKAAFGKGALEAGDAKSLSQTGVGWLAAAAHRRSVRRQTTLALEASGKAFETGQALFTRHVERLSESHHFQQRPLSLATLTLQPSTHLDIEGWTAQSRQGFELVRGLIRASDLAAQWDPKTLLLLLPQTSLQDAGELTERAAGVLENTGFVGLQAPLAVHHCVNELAQGECGQRLLERALAAARSHRA